MLLTTESDVTDFTNKLPPKLRALLQLKMHEHLFEKISLFKLHNYPASLYAWMTNNLRSRVKEPGTYIYQDGDQVHNMYFLTKGLAGFALPRRGCVYIIIEPGDSFGLVDITHNLYQIAEKELENEFDFLP